MEILLANCVDPDHMPHYVVSDLGLCCLPITLFPGKNWLKVNPILERLRFTKVVPQGKIWKYTHT